MLISGVIFTTTLAFADFEVSDLQRRAHEADLEARAALEFTNRFQAADEILFLPKHARASAFEQADRLRNAAAGARATYHRLMDIAAELHSAVSKTRPQVRPSDYDYRIVDTITSDIVQSAIIVEVPTPEVESSHVSAAEPVEISIESNVEAPPGSEPAFESGPVPQTIDEDAVVNTTMMVGSMPIETDTSTNVAPVVEGQLSTTVNTVGSIGPVPASKSASQQAAEDARTLANRALNFAVEMQVAADEAQANYDRFKNFEGKVDKQQFAELKARAAMMNEEARLAEFEYQELDSRAAAIEAEVKAANSQ